MYFRSDNIEDPWISLTDHIDGANGGTDLMIYGEGGGDGNHKPLLTLTGGLRVYALKKGNYQDCISGLEPAQVSSRRQLAGEKRSSKPPVS